MDSLQFDSPDYLDQCTGGRGPVKYAVLPIFDKYAVLYWTAIGLGICLSPHPGGEWDPHVFFEEELAGQAEEELPDYYVPILATGVRPEFEMEQVVPGDLDPSADGPILEAVYAKDMGDPSRAEGILMNLPREDLRCLHGYGLCLWRLEHFGEAEEVFERMLWLNPSDNQGARFLIIDVREKRPWRLDL